MSTYVIDFSEPLKAGFSIPAGGLNGPGGSSANTTLRLYGRSALEWGEAVNENLVRLTENFTSASAPSVATSGQMWSETLYYYHNNSLGVLGGWYFYDVNSVAANKWTLVSGTGNVPSIAPLTPVEGEYYYTPGGADPAPSGTPGAPTGQLRGFYSLGRYEPATWVERSYMSGVGAPSAGNYPEVHLRIRDGARAAWVSPVTTAVTSGVSPSNTTPGALWYDSSTGNLHVRTTVGTWQKILGPSNGTSASVASGPVNMGGYTITNLAAPTSGTDVATKNYVDGIGAGAGAGTFLPLTGGTLSVTASPGLTNNRTNASTDSTMRFQTTAGSIYVGQGAANTFAVGNTGSLSVAAFISATSSLFSVAQSAFIGSDLAAQGNVSVGGTLSVTGTTTLSSTLSLTGTFNLAGNALITGTITMNGTRILNLANPSGAQDAATKAYVDTAVAGAVSGAPTSSQVALVNPAGAPKNGDIRTTSPNIIEIYAFGVWRRVFPAQWAA